MAYGQYGSFGQQQQQPWMGGGTMPGAGVGSSNPQDYSGGVGGVPMSVRGGGMPIQGGGQHPVLSGMGGGQMGQPPSTGNNALTKGGGGMPPMMGGGGGPVTPPQGANRLRMRADGVAPMGGGGGPMAQGGGMIKNPAAGRGQLPVNPYGGRGFMAPTQAQQQKYPGVAW